MPLDGLFTITVKIYTIAFMEVPMNRRRIKGLSFIMALSASWATIASNAFIDGKIPHHPALALTGAFLTLGFLLVSGMKPPDQ